MCSLATPRAAALGLGATSFLDRRQGLAVVAAAAAAPAPATHHRARGADAPAPAPKRGRDGSDVVVDPASSTLRVRMDVELVAVQGLLKKARLLSRSARPAAAAGKKYALRRSEAAPPVVSSAAARRTTSQSKAATEAAYAAYQAKKITAPAAKQQRPVQRAADTPIAKAEEAPKKKLRPEEELARAAARLEFRQMLIEMEKAALPDETIYPEDLEELGIALYEHDVTRTRKQAWLEDHAKITARHGVRSKALLAV